MAEVYYGELGIDKRRIVNNFMRYVPEFPLKGFSQILFNQYLDPDYFNDKADSEIEEFYQLCFDFADQIIDLILD